jgi:hypothetical protein
VFSSILRAKDTQTWQQSQETPNPRYEGKSYGTFLNSIRKAPILAFSPFPTAFFLKPSPPDTYVLSGTPIPKPSPTFSPDNSFFIGTFAVYILFMRRDENRLYKKYAASGILKNRSKS